MAKFRPIHNYSAVNEAIAAYAAGSVGGNGLVDGGIIVDGAELGHGLARGLGGLVGGDELVRRCV